MTSRALDTVEFLVELRESEQSDVAIAMLISNYPHAPSRSQKLDLEAAAASPRPGCPIKGNISVGSGERIYHTPWSASYARTVIDASKGERWFCDEAEAIAAGWRPARSR